MSIYTRRFNLMAVCANAAIYLVLLVTIQPLFLMFGTIVGEPPIWQKIVFYTLFPLAGLHRQNRQWAS